MLPGGGGLTCSLSDSWRSRLPCPPLCDFWGSFFSWLDNPDSSCLFWFFSFLFWLFFSSPFLSSCFGRGGSGEAENTSGFPVSLGRSDSSIRFFMGSTLMQEEKRQKVRTEVDWAPADLASSALRPSFLVSQSQGRAHLP